jgi:hypothetical protein
MHGLPNSAPSTFVHYYFRNWKLLIHNSFKSNITPYPYPCPPTAHRPDLQSRPFYILTLPEPFIPAGPLMVCMQSAGVKLHFVVRNIHHSLRIVVAVLEEHHTVFDFHTAVGPHTQRCTLLVEPGSSLGSRHTSCCCDDGVHRSI